MAKDTYYFSHDYDPLGDPKTQAMIGDYGAIGYGIFWRIVEMLHTDSKHKLPFKRYIYSAIAKQMSTNVQQKETKGLHVEISAEQVEVFVKDCINEYELFHSDAEFFWSNRALRNIEHKDTISEKRSKAGKKSAESRKKTTKVQQKSTLVEQVQTNVEQNPTKEIKGNKIKGNKNTHREPEKLLTKEIVEESVSVLVNGLPEMRIKVFHSCEDWEFDEIIDFLTKSDSEFYMISTNKPILKSNSNFEKALQKFISMVQEQSKYQTCGKYKEHFSNWLNSKNGSLEEYLNGKSEKNDAKKVKIVL